MLDYWLFKKIYELALCGDHEEVKKVLAILQEKYIAMCDENSMFKLQLQEFEDIVYLANSLIHDGDLYWLRTGNIKQGPFCRTCYDNKGVLLRLYDRDTQWRCYTCGAVHSQVALPREPAVQEISELPRAGLVPSRKVIPFCK